MAQQSQRCVTETAIPGGWATREVTVGSQQFEIVLPAEPDAFLEQLAEPDDTEIDPYWAAVWSASRQLAELVLARRWERGTPALELGCGVGLLGLEGLAAGLDVTFTDLHELAVATALQNATRNGFPAARGHILNWRAPDGERFPLILAADVLYDAQLHPPLLATLQARLAGDGVCWLGDPGRSAAATFVEAAAKGGFDVQLQDERGAAADSLRLGQFRLLSLRRRATT